LVARWWHAAEEYAACNYAGMRIGEGVRCGGVGCGGVRRLTQDDEENTKIPDLRRSTETYAGRRREYEDPRSAEEYPDLRRTTKRMRREYEDSRSGSFNSLTGTPMGPNEPMIRSVCLGIILTGF
jgi:hypothetical protein